MLTSGNELKELRVAGILDELSCFCFPYECRFLELDVVGYIEEMEKFKPQMLFVESAWHGKENHWYRKLYNLSSEICEILNWCNANKVPTVFWNKEDPVHFDTFLGVASRFDWVYTTDMDCVPLYKRLLKHNRIGVLPFAVSPHSFHPIEKYERKEKACFAGGWYSLQKERCADFDKIFDLCSEVTGIDIYDRNVYPGNPDYTFPDKYKGNIVGSLPMNKIDVAYKGYSYGITMNTVKYSSTMEARRIFELMACNTVSLSNPSTGIKNLFGDLVIAWENEEQFRKELAKAQNAPNYKEKLCLLALRKVMQQHTYEERMNKICEDVLGWERAENGEKVCSFSMVSSNGEMQRVIRNWQRQAYPSELILVADISLKEDLRLLDKVTLVDRSQYASIAACSDADFYCYMSSNNYYGSNYLTDLIVATKYISSPIIGKGSYFRNVGGTYSLENRKLSYSIINSLKSDRCIVKKHIAEHCYTADADLESLDIEGFVGASVDFLNFCENEHSAACGIVDDCTVDAGYSIEEIYGISKLLPNQKHYTMQERWTGKEFLRDAAWGYGKIKCLEFQEGWVGLCPIANDGKKLYAQLTKGFDAGKYSIGGFTRVFMEGEARGDVNVMLHFLDNTGSLIRKVWFKVGTYLRAPVPEGAATFYFSIAMASSSRILLREVVINAFPEKNIDLEKALEEGRAAWKTDV